ncbi:MAG: oligosaccharide flippase family protein [Bacteroidetes bacterium]|jgi:O-antigen/teichoic acid export membrane protein|nr:oligosaccharide flippase family protein [Bacteroidota bacterium]
MAKNSVISGVLWTGFEAVISRVFTFIVKLLLAKLLLPEDFGLVGMITVFSSFITVLNELGFASALVQREDKKLRESHYDTVFWTTLVWSILLYGFIYFLISPLVANFYDEPRIEAIMPVLTLNILFVPFALIPRVKLTRDLRFKELSISTIYGSILSGILSLVLALLDFGVWALVFNYVAMIIVAIPILYYYMPWKPKLIWKVEDFKDIFGFGTKTLGTNLFNNLISQFDYLVIGRLLSAQLLGVYTLSFIITDMFRSQLMAIVNKVMYPNYSKLQNDSVKLANSYLNVIKYNAAAVYPFMLVLIIYAEQIILTFYDETWSEAIAPIQIIAISVLFHMLVNSNTSLIRASGRPGLEFKLQVFKALVFFVPAVFIGVYYFGLIGAAWAMVFHKIASVIVAQFILQKYFGITFRMLFKRLQSIIIAFGVSLLIAILFNSLFENVWMLGVGLIFVSYLGVLNYLDKDFIALFNRIWKKN